jgi:hypothetical protein
VRNITQRQRTIAAQIHIPHLNIGLQVAQVVLGGQFRADLAIALFVMNRRNLQIIIAIIIQHGKEAEITHDFWRHKLADKAFIFKIAHGEMQRFQPVGTGNIREPVFVFPSETDKCV